ncbi:hypothetical protein E2C01_068359 [Portunus trituberculatus]|uniref:Uncharacterized protein n=1 Tax=Portunus trituberculatus TaxID=210409 RepID=A0A5B7HW01_PORTR|nr:hypothetical protein [Portunus trituberculatus]
MIGFCEVAARSLLLRVPISSVAGRRVWRGGSASGGAQLPLSLPDVAASYMFTLSADYRIIARYNSGRKAARGLGGEGGQGVWEAGRAGEERGRDVCRGRNARTLAKATQFPAAGGAAGERQVGLWERTRWRTPRCVTK